MFFLVWPKSFFFCRVCASNSLCLGGQPLLLIRLFLIVKFFKLLPYPIARVYVASPFSLPLSPLLSLTLTWFSENKRKKKVERKVKIKPFFFLFFFFFLLAPTSIFSLLFFREGRIGVGGKWHRKVDTPTPSRRRKNKKPLDFRELKRGRGWRKAPCHVILLIELCVCVRYVIWRRLVVAQGAIASSLTDPTHERIDKMHPVACRLASLPPPPFPSAHKIPFALVRNAFDILADAHILPMDSISKMGHFSTLPHTIDPVDRMTTNICIGFIVYLFFPIGRLKCQWPFGERPINILWSYFRFYFIFLIIITVVFFFNSFRLF